MKQQIKRLEEPSLKCVSLVYDELVRILTQLLSKALYRRYPSLKEKMHNVVIGFFKKAMEPTNKLVKDLVAMESIYVNTGHPDFLNGHKAMSIVTERMNQNKPQHAEGKGGKVTPAQLNNNRDLEVDVKEEQSFFGTFFAKGQREGEPASTDVKALEAIRLRGALITFPGLHEKETTFVAVLPSFSFSVHTDV